MKKRNLLFLITCFAGLCAYLFIVFYGEAEKTAIRNLNDEQQIHAKQAARGIEDFFTTWTGILRSFSKMDSMISFDADGKRYMILFYEAHHEQIRSITRVNERGRILYTVPHSHVIGSDISGQKHMLEILRDHKPVVSDVFKTVQGFDAVALHVPVFKGATFKGTIAIIIDFENLTKRYLEVIKIGKTGYAWVVSRDGIMLYSHVPGFTGKSVFDTFRGFPSIISMTKDMLQGRQGTATYIFDKIGDQTVSPMKKYAVYMPIHIANSFWSVAVASSEDEVLSSLASFRNKLILVIIIMLLGGVLLSIISAKAWLIVAEEEKRKRAEEALRKRDQLMSTMSKIAQMGGWEFETETLKGTWTDEVAQIHDLDPGMETSAEIGLSFYHGESREKIETAIKEAIHSFKPYDLELEMTTAKGNRKWVRTIGNPIKEGNRVVKLMGTFQDITKRKQAELELEKHRGNLEEMVKQRTGELQDSRRALMSLIEDLDIKKKELEAANIRLKEIDRLKSLFIASMSHELRTPLNSIIGFSSILLNEWAGPLSDEQKDNLATVLRSGKHLLSLINDVIDVSKIEAGTVDVHAEDFDLHDVIAETAKQFEKEAKDRGLEFTIENLHQPMHTDRRRLLQSVMNLVSNAVKFTERGSVRVQARLSAECGVRSAELIEEKHLQRSLPSNVSIGGTPNPELDSNLIGSSNSELRTPNSELDGDLDYIEIIVEDTGIGIKPEDIPKLFHSFVRLDSPLRATVLGTGLGLYLTKKLVTKALWGKIFVESTPGKGSRFGILIPIKAMK